MGQILEDIRSAIASLDAKPEKSNVGDDVYDASLAGTLARLRASLASA